jgi:hypothetical protein
MSLLRFYELIRHGETEISAARHKAKIIYSIGIIRYVLFKRQFILQKNNLTRFTYQIIE